MLPSAIVILFDLQQ